MQQRYLYLREQVPTRGWGLYVFDLQSPEGVVVEVPAPLDEWSTMEAGLSVFLQLEGGALAVVRGESEQTAVELLERLEKDGFDGELKEFNPRGFVKDDPSNALWGMRFVWPIKADYRIVYLDQNYSQTIIGRQKRDFIWIMARTPEISDEDYQQLIRSAEELGYDATKIERVPQSW